jgi:hypothetical protein
MKLVLSEYEKKIFGLFGNTMRTKTSGTKEREEVK